MSAVLVHQYRGQSSLHAQPCFCRPNVLCSFRVVRGSKELFRLRRYYIPVNISCLKLGLVSLVATALAGCHSPPRHPPDQWPEAAKIKLRLGDIRPDGLRGPPDGLVSVTYEFCVPADERVYQEVRRIDPSVQISPAVPGRIGCSKTQALCTGNTHQPRWREVLKGLSSLPYILEIRECFFE